jgi:hypothetical protein
LSALVCWLTASPDAVTQVADLWRVALGTLLASLKTMWQWVRWLIGVVAVVVAVLRVARWLLVPALPFDPVAYDHQRVHLEGTVTTLESTGSHRGNPYYFFVLDTGRGTVVAFKFGSPRCVEGQRATVEGVFHHMYQRGGYTFTDEIDAESVNCS